MPECGTRTEAMRAGTPVTVGAVTLLPIERVVLNAQRRGARQSISAALEPYALVVRDSTGVRAIDAAAMAVSLEALREEVPGLESALAAIRGRQP